MFSKRLVPFVALLALVPARAPAEQGVVVRHLRSESPRQAKLDAYYVRLLRLALDETVPRDGPFRIEPFRAAVRKSEALEALSRGTALDVMWLMTSVERERRYLPVRIPLQRGLLGRRVLLVRERDREKFEGVSSVEDLKGLEAGLGASWVDRKIFENSGLPVYPVPNYESLFFLLRQGKFDYIPTGVNEAWTQLPDRGRDGLVVEDHLLLAYPSPIYFFFAPGREALAARVERGLRLAIRDGSFDQVFFHHPTQEAMFTRAHMGERTVIPLENPVLPPETPLDEAALWYRLGDETR